MLKNTIFLVVASFSTLLLWAPPAEAAPDCDGDNDGVHGTTHTYCWSGKPAPSACTGGATVDCFDNCPMDANPAQEDQDGDGIGDVCDPTTAPPTDAGVADVSVDSGADVGMDAGMHPDTGAADVGVSDDDAGVHADMSVSDEDAAVTTPGGSDSGNEERDEAPGLDEVQDTGNPVGATDEVGSDEGCSSVGARPSGSGLVVVFLVGLVRIWRR